MNVSLCTHTSVVHPAPLSIIPRQPPGKVPSLLSGRLHEHGRGGIVRSAASEIIGERNSRPNRDHMNTDCMWGDLWVSIAISIEWGPVRKMRSRPALACGACQRQPNRPTPDQWMPQVRPNYPPWRGARARCRSGGESQAIPEIRCGAKRCSIGWDLGLPWEFLESLAELAD